MVKGQSYFEFAMLATCVVAALLTMQIYAKRAVEGRVREVSDQIGEHYSSKYEARNERIDVWSNWIVTPNLVWVRNPADNSLITEVSTNLPVYGVETTIDTNETTGKARLSPDKLDDYESSLYD